MIIEIRRDSAGLKTLLNDKTYLDYTKSLVLHIWHVAALVAKFINDVAVDDTAFSVSITVEINKK